MRAISSPTAARVARTASRLATQSVRDIRIFMARKPTAFAATTASARACGLLALADEALADQHPPLVLHGGMVSGGGVGQAAGVRSRRPPRRAAQVREKDERAKKKRRKPPAGYKE